MKSKTLLPSHPSTFQKKITRQYKKKPKKKQEDQVRRFIVMNQNGEFFSGFANGSFKWSLSTKDARELDSIEQFKTIQRHEPLMEVVYDYI